MHRPIRNRYPAALIFMILCFIAAMSGSAYAQPAMMSPKDRAANLKERLSLTDSQMTAINKIFAESQQAMKIAMDSARGDRGAMREVRMNMMKKSDERIDSLLTVDQKKKYEDLKKERRGRMRGRP
jgi:Spy/CpxP family protein refolding chaperone